MDPVSAAIISAITAGVCGGTTEIFNLAVVDSSVLSGTLLMLCGQAEQSFGRGLNFLLGNPGA